MSDPRDTRPLGPARREVRRELHEAQMVELAQMARDVSEAEHRVGVSRARLDSRLYYLHEQEGVAIAELARAAGRSRETVYAAIDRYRASIPPSTVDAPQVAGEGLSDMQLDGHVCVVCGRADDRPLVSAGFGPRGQVFRHAECPAG